MYNFTHILLTEMTLVKDIIETVAASSFFCKKEGQNIWFCVDYRWLNKGIWQEPLTKEDCPETVFTTPKEFCNFSIVIRALATFHTCHQRNRLLGY